MKERYEGIDGLKAYAIIGIALIEWVYVPEADTILYESCVPFYDGQRFWHVLRLLPEIQGSENWCGRVLQQKVQQDLAIFRIALCAGLRNVT